MSINKFILPINFFSFNAEKKQFVPIGIEKMNLLISLLIWWNLRNRNICQVFHTVTYYFYCFYLFSNNFFSLISPIGYLEKDDGVKKSNAGLQHLRAVNYSIDDKVIVNCKYLN